MYGSKLSDFRSDLLPVCRLLWEFYIYYYAVDLVNLGLILN
jgi:hypothetical protein